jgi:hypothetical protein
MSEKGGREMEMIIFPSARRVGLIRKTARDALGLNREAGDNIIRARIDQQRATFLRRGFPAAVVEREMRTLESAIRARMWRAVMTSGGAA